MPALLGPPQLHMQVSMWPRASLSFQPYLLFVGSPILEPYLRLSSPGPPSSRMPHALSSLLFCTCYSICLEYFPYLPLLTSIFFISIRCHLLQEATLDLPSARSRSNAPPLCFSNNQDPLLFRLSQSCIVIAGLLV